MSDFAKFERPALLHLAYQALDAFVKESGQLPRPYNKEDGLKLVELAKKINSEATNKVCHVSKISCCFFSLFCVLTVKEWKLFLIVQDKSA